MRRCLFSVILLVFSTIMKVDCVGASEPHRIMVIGKDTPAEYLPILREFETSLSHVLDATPHIELVANPEERELLLKELEFVISDIASEEDQVELGNWRGEQKVLVLSVQGSAIEGGHIFQVIILDLETARKNTLVHFDKGGDIATAVHRLSYQVKANLAPRGKVIDWVSKKLNRIDVDMGENLGIERGQRLVVKDGKRILARLVVISVGYDRAVADIESGWDTVDIGTEVIIEFPPIPSGEAGRLIVSAPETLDGAKVYVDRKVKGVLEKGRLDLELWRGEHEIEVRGRKVFKKKINLNDVEVVSFDLPGLLNVQSQDGALVSVKGEGGVEWRSLGTSNRSYELPRGVYQVRISKKGYLPQQLQEYVDADQETNVQIGLLPIIDMVFVQGGNFIIGSADELTNPPRQIAVPSYYIDKREVTVAQYIKVFPHFQPPTGYPADVAVSGVSWFEANDYCETVGKRLPTEVEWECACKGANNTKYGYGNQYDARLTDARRAGNNVREYPLSGSTSNDWGVNDMTGGVWEWTAVEKSATTTERVIRGGAWIMPEPEKRANCVYRRKADPQDRGMTTIGFRCAMDADE
jgi:hypothetical protein